ncbi:chain length determinant protein EpsF [Azohydromonas caseinilytica]|uniref:Chain length determinant protein EpsF n=1 Tax=Azohydromonas caseinilytica TaxID=2728836 RepID=A0A848FDR3_9BURK|nr:chain length determinant protein EpsF [Azohydromonas caseinilytica]NML17528.1 chain length determinant protein EpsF [Azohydromonas caseinilytica]
MSIAQFLAILLARWKVVLAVLLATVLTTIGISLLLPKSYTGSASVLVQVAVPDPIAGIGLSSQLVPQVITSQVEILSSDRVAQRAVRLMRLNENADLRAQWQEATQGVGAFEAWLGDMLQINLQVVPSQSNIIAVNYKSPDPKLAAATANAFVQAYLETALELRVDPARQSAAFFDERAKSLRQQLDKAQMALSKYQQDNGIVATDERIDIETARLNELSSQLVAVQALAAESRSRQAAANGASDRLQDTLNSGVVNQLRGELSRQEASLSQLSARLGDAHPQVREAKAAIASLRTRLDNEVARVAGGVGVSNRINQSREAEIRTALESQRERVLKLKAQRDGMASLLRDVDNAQKAYDTVLARLNTTSIESQATMTNLIEFSKATEPIAPSSPQITLNVIVATFVGSLLAVGAALVLEFMNRRVRSPSDIVQLVDMQVIGVLPKPDRKNWFRVGRPGSMQTRLVGYHGRAV